MGTTVIVILVNRVYSSLAHFPREHNVVSNTWAHFGCIWKGGKIRN